MVRKESVPLSDYIISEKEFDFYTDAVAYAVEMLQKPRMNFWNVVLRFNRGLGIEYKNLSDVYTSTKEEAVILANEQVEPLLKSMKITTFEVKVKLKNGS